MKFVTFIAFDHTHMTKHQSFKVTSPRTNTDPKSLGERVYGGTQDIFINFLPGFLQGFFKRLSVRVGFCAGFAFQYGPD